MFLFFHRYRTVAMQMVMVMIEVIRKELLRIDRLWVEIILGQPIDRNENVLEMILIWMKSILILSM